MFVLEAHYHHGKRMSHDGRHFKTASLKCVLSRTLSDQSPLAICPSASASLYVSHFLLITNNHLVPVVVWRTTTTHDRRKSNLLVDLCHPLLVLLRRSLTSEDNIHFLKTQSLRLGNKEPNECRSNEGQQTEQNVRSIRDMLKEIRRDLSNDKVIHPVTRSTQCRAVRAGADRPDFSNQNPCTGTPGVAKVDDEEPHHDHSGPTGALRVVEVVDVFGEDDSDDYMGYAHANGADGEDRLSANAVDVKDSGN